METEIVNAVVNSPNTLEILLRASGPLFGLLVLIGVFLIAHKYIPQMISSFNNLSSEVKLMREALTVISGRIDDTEESTTNITKRLDAIENARRRGLILQNLKQKYPDGVDFIVLQKALEIQGHSLSKRELAVLIEYLNGGEYIWVTYSQKYILVVTLSKKGIDLLDKSISDVGVLVD